MTDPTPGLTIVYDGACPFCSNYVSLMALRKSVGAVHLVDARSAQPIVRELQNRGVDLDEGMVVIHGGETYYGSDALALLSMLSSNATPLQSAIAFSFRNPKVAKAMYPFLKAGRRVTLKILGRKPIDAAV